MYPSFNDTGEIIAKKQPDTIAVTDLPEDDVMVREGIFKKAGDHYKLSPSGIENLITRKLGLEGSPVHSGNVSILGSVKGRNICYCSCPNDNFYSLYKESTSLIIGSNDAVVDRGWSGRAALLSALFTIKNGNVTFVRSTLNHLFPEIGEKVKSIGKKHKKHQRDIEYLKIFAVWIADVQKRTPKNSNRLELITRPRVSELAALLNENKTHGKISNRTIYRDIGELDQYKSGKTKCTPRHALVAKIWQNITNPNLVLDPKTIKIITDEMAKGPDESNTSIDGKFIFAKTGWEDDADEYGRGSTRTIAVDPELDIDKVFSYQ